MGKYRCLLCQKEFSSESGVKYHIIKAHSEVRKQPGLLRGPAATRPRSVCPSPAPQILLERGAAAPISISRVGTASGQGTELLCQPGGGSVLKNLQGGDAKGHGAAGAWEKGVREPALWGCRGRGRSLTSPVITPWMQNWFRTAAEASRKKKSREQLSSSKEEKKKSTNGKKRGRKPKERPPEISPKGKESLAAKTNHKKSPEHWEGSRCSPAGDERVPKPPSQHRKGGGSKVPEK